MLRSFLAGTLAALPLAFTLAPSPANPATAAAAQAGCQDLWAQHPLVVYDVTGSTLAGPVDLSLVVYDSGVAKLSSASGAPGQGKARVEYLTPQATLALARALFQSGSFQTCDQPLAGSDVPLKTLTVFRGGTDAKAHSFSWWITENEYAVLEQHVTDFIGAHFGGF